MQPIGQLLPAAINSTQQKHSTSSSDEPPNKKIAALFRLMMAAYGHRYRSTFKSERDVELAMQVWGRAIGDRQIEVLSAAFDVCSKRFDWPPSLSEFMDALKSIERPILDRLRTRERLSQLPPPNMRVSQERAAELISGLRSILK